MTSQKLSTPPVQKETLLSGTYQQLLDYFTERLLSRDEAEKRIAKETTELHPVKGVGFDDFHIAWALDQQEIVTQLKNTLRNNEGVHIRGAFGAIFYMRYAGIHTIGDGKPQPTMSLMKQFILIRPDDWYDKATEGLNT